MWAFSEFRSFFCKLNLESLTQFIILVYSSSGVRRYPRIVSLSPFVRAFPPSSWFLLPLLNLIRRSASVAAAFATPGSRREFHLGSTYGAATNLLDLTRKRSCCRLAYDEILFVLILAYLAPKEMFPFKLRKKRANEIEGEMTTSLHAGIVLCFPLFLVAFLIVFLSGERMNKLHIG